MTPRIANYRAIVLSLFMTYFVFAILLNSVGTVILQVINNYGVGKKEASILEAFKDLPIAFVSLCIAAFLPRIGFRRSMIVGMGLVGSACLLMPVLPGFMTAKLLFLSVGVGFALVKVSVYSTVGLLTKTPNQHASLLNSIEGMFMVGMLSGYWIFSFFIDSDNPASLSWLNTYWLLSGMSFFSMFLLIITPIDESSAKPKGAVLRDDFLAMWKLMALPLVLVYVISAFLYVLIEQGIGSWLPTFNNEILHLPAAMSVQAASIFAASLAIGRLGAGVLMHRFGWYPLLNICFLMIAGLILLSMPMTLGLVAHADMSWFSAPLAAFLFPLIGLFMAPIYPAINSVMLSALPKYQHASMSGLIVIFSALGGTVGSRMIGTLYDLFDGQTAFYTLLVPITAIAVSIFFFRRCAERFGISEQIEEAEAAKTSDVA
jgi:MFS transporter, FHS family, glucose/mannose:H+ symporter